MTHASGPGFNRLTDQQLEAISSQLPRVFIEAEPGSGKTTVSALRFGVLRFRSRVADTTSGDSRGVIGLSFTRSATSELRSRVLQEWGTRSLARPHRIVTIDALIYELVQYLLVTGAVKWPGAITRLVVHDSWSSAVPMKWGKAVRSLTLVDNMVSVVGAWAPRAASRPVPGQLESAIAAGVCTHEDVRSVLEAAIERPALRALLVERLRSTVRAAIVDEVFDANHLDLRVVALLFEADVQVTLVGDPWQALYGFRGAQPDLVPRLLTASNTKTLPLSAAFRWDTAEQRDLADALRAGIGVSLPAGSMTDANVALACTWKQLWSADTSVLPLAFGSPKGSAPEASAILLLSCLSRRVVGEESPYLRDALSTLGIELADYASLVEPGLHEVIQLLHKSGPQPLKDAYAALVSFLSPLGTVSHPAVHHSYTNRLGLIRERVHFDGQLIPGLTAHQAKGREWNYVGVCLTDRERNALAGGISSVHEPQRQLYVACTRARRQTFEV